VVRFRGKELGCMGCLRITVGTKEEVNRFLKEIGTVLEGIYASTEVNGVEDEAKKEREANDIVA